MPFVNPTGMGANCHKHKNEVDGEGNCCQTGVRFTVAGSEAGARRCVKAWLLAGVDATSRTHHMDMRRGIVARAAEFTEADEAAMDAAAAAAALLREQ